MMRNRLLTSLVAVTVIMQLIILYRQPVPPSRQPPTADAPKDFYIDLANFPYMGSDNANAIILEFSDYECPFCARHATTVLPDLMKDYVSRGLVRYALANNPLAIHSNAQLMARVALCAGDEGKYWEMHDRLFTLESKSRDAVISLVDSIPNGQTLNRCLETRTDSHAKIIKRDQDLAERLGLRGTPSFAIGRIEDERRARLIKVIRGSVSTDVFSDVLDDVLDGVVSKKL